MLSRPRAIAAAAVTAAAIAAATAGCQPQDSIASSPAALSAPQSVSAHTARVPRPHHTSDAKHHKHTAKPAPAPTTSTTAPASATPTPVTPTPTQTSPSPVATTATPAPTSSTSTSSCTTSAAQGSCGPYTYPQMQGTTTAPTVNNDVWSPISGWQQTLHANNPGDWGVTANMPAGNTAVVSYPSNEATYGERSLSSFSKIDSSFSENMNATSKTSAWAAYDIWGNNWGYEVMIQHDFANNGACSYVATADFGGSNGVPVQKWGLCQYGTELIWKLTSGSEQSGSVDILAMLTWLESHGYLPSNSTLTAIGYGWEICSTGGANENFQVSSYSLTES